MSVISDLPVIENLIVEEWAAGRVHHLRVRMAGNGLGQHIHMPVILVRGAHPGPVVGVTAAMHGNELNGVRVIHRLLQELVPATLRGTVIAVPVVNVPGYLRNQREFNDGVDLNRIMPGRPDGNCSQVYAHRLMTRVIQAFDYHVDLHTASFGRVNSLYVRADLSHPETRWMALAQNAQIIVHNCGGDGTLRSACMERGIPSITVEVGDPQRFQPKMIRMGYWGVANVLAHLDMLDLDEESPDSAPRICIRSYWMYTTAGGVLTVMPQLLEAVQEGQVVGRVNDIYGNLIETYRAPESGVVIGRSTNPVNQTGSRILHLGIPGDLEQIAVRDVPGR